MTPFVPTQVETQGHGLRPPDSLWSLPPTKKGAGMSAGEISDQTPMTKQAKRRFKGKAKPSRARARTRTTSMRARVASRSAGVRSRLIFIARLEASGAVLVG